jgi:hypothetical protein
MIMMKTGSRSLLVRYPLRPRYPNSHPCCERFEVVADVPDRDVEVAAEIQSVGRTGADEMSQKLARSWPPSPALTRPFVIPSALRPPLSPLAAVLRLAVAKDERGAEIRTRPAPPQS